MICLRAIGIPQTGMPKHNTINAKFMAGKIKSIKRFNQNYKNFSFAAPGELAEREYLDLIVKLDEKGNVIEEAKYSADETLEEKNSYSFNDQGKLMSHMLFYALDNVTEKRVLTRNAEGLLVEEIKYYGDDAGERTTYGYNEKNLVTRIERFDEEGDFAGCEEMSYDPAGSLSERITFDAERKILSKIRFSPPVENKVEEIESDADGKIISKTMIQFDEKGKELSTVQTNPDGKLISSIRNVYNEKGNVVEKVYKDYYSKTFTYSYNDRDLLAVQELFDESGILLRKNIFEYDDQGNVVTEQSYEMDTTRGGRDRHHGLRYEYEFY
jgi:hypothetical protein